VNQRKLCLFDSTTAVRQSGRIAPFQLTHTPWERKEGKGTVSSGLRARVTVAKQWLAADGFCQWWWLFRLHSAFCRTAYTFIYLDLLTHACMHICDIYICHTYIYTLHTLLAITHITRITHRSHIRHQTSIRLVARCHPLPIRSVTIVMSGHR